MWALAVVTWPSAVFMWPGRPFTSFCSLLFQCGLQSWPFLHVWRKYPLLSMYVSSRLTYSSLWKLVNVQLSLLSHTVAFLGEIRWDPTRYRYGAVRCSSCTLAMLCDVATFLCTFIVTVRIAAIQISNCTLKVALKIVGCVQEAMILGWNLHTGGAIELVLTGIDNPSNHTNTDCNVTHSSSGGSLVSCPACVHLPVRNGLVNEVEFLGLITQKR